MNEIRENVAYESSSIESANQSFGVYKNIVSDQGSRSVTGSGILQS